MPWYEPCASNGYTKFLQNPQLRENKWIVSDDYLQSLLTAYRQGYVNAGGPDYEDSDDALLNTLAENCVGNTSGASSLGAQDAKRDIAAKMDYHPQSLSPGGAIPVTAPIGTPIVAPVDPSSGVVYTQGLTNPTGQPGENPVMMPAIAPAAGGGWLTGSGGASGAGSAAAPTGTGGIPWLLIVAAGAAAWFLMRK